MNILDNLYDYINEEAKKFFGETEAYSYIDPSKWFLIHFPYILKNNIKNNEMLLLIKFEIHSYEVRGLLCYCANLGFSIVFSEGQEFFLPYKNKDFRIEIDKDNLTISYHYKWENELNTNESEDVIILNEHILEIIDKFFIDIVFYKKNDLFLKQYSLPKDVSSRNNRNNILKILINYNFNPTTLYKAYDYYKMNRVVSFEHKKYIDFDLLCGNVAGHNNNLYDVFVKYNNSTLIDYKCQCPAFKNYDGPCKHIICLLIKGLDSNR